MAKNVVKSPGKGQVPILFVGAGFVALIILILLGMLFPRNRDAQKDSDLLRSIDGKVREMETRLRRLEGLDKRLALLDKQTTEFAISIMDRVDKLEASMSRRVAQIVKDQTNVHRAAVEVNKKGTDSPAPTGRPEKKANPVYHRVQAGETLYRISLNYGLNVEGLLRLNNLKAGAVIYAGQKLIVGTAKKK